MPLSLDVTSGGLIPAPDDTSGGAALPTVTTTQSDGRWGFGISDTTGIEIPKQRLGDDFFNADAYTVSFSMKATAGAASAGQVARIQNNLTLEAKADGSFRLDFINAAGDRTTVYSLATAALDGNWHDVTVSFDNSQSEIGLYLDDTQILSASVNGSTTDQQYWGMHFGSVWGITGFTGLIDDVFVDDIATTPSGGGGPSTGVDIQIDFASAYDGMILFGDAHTSGGNVLTLDGQGDYARVDTFDAWDSADGFTASLDFRFTDAGAVGYSYLLADQSVFDLKAKGSALNLMVNTAGGQQWNYIGGLDFTDLAWHTVELEFDAVSDRLRLTVDGAIVLDRSDLDLVLPSSNASVHIGGLPWGTQLKGEIDNIAISALASAPPPPPGETTITLDFETPPPPSVSLFGDAAVGTAGTLELDGSGDYATVDPLPAWSDPTAFSASLDFKFNPTAGAGYAQALFSAGAFQIKVKGDALNLMVETPGGPEWNYVGGMSFDDQSWHTLDLSINAATDELTLLVDDVAVVHRTDLDLILPASIAPVSVGGLSWGAELDGEIDNVVLSADTAIPLQDAAGLANPALASNVGSMPEWFESSQAIFIDRMKGAFSWDGEFAYHTSSAGSVHVFKSPQSLGDAGSVVDVAFGPDTLLSVHVFSVAAHYGQGLIDANTYWDMQGDPNSYFKLEVGVSGNTELFARLDKTDPFELIGRLDQDIGMDLDGLRAAGQMQANRGDLLATFDDIVLDENGWPTVLPMDASGAEGKAYTTVMWYPAEAANAPNSIYSGNFYLMADGEGTIDLKQYGAGPSLLDMTNIVIDGPTMVPFTYIPNGDQVRLTINSSDPNDVGEDLRDIRIIHEDHLPLYEAGEIFTPEYLSLTENMRVVRWMNAQESVHLSPEAEGTFDNARTMDFYSFNMGTDNTEFNGVPIDAIIEYSNQTGTDPWINVPINASDAFVSGMAAYVEANLDPRLKVYVELGNENWNPIFETNAYAVAEGLARWGELQLQMDSGGQFVRDGFGDLIVLQPGYFFSQNDAAANGYDLASLATELGLGHALYADNDWSQWTAMRTTQVASIFENTFTTADPANGSDRVQMVAAASTHEPEKSGSLLTASLWQEAEPGAWIDPATLIESLAIGGYMGAETGSRGTDLVMHWVDTYGQAQAVDLAVRNLSAGLDPALNYVELDYTALLPDGSVDPNQVVTGVSYASDLIVDVSEPIYVNNTAVQDDILNGVGVTQNQDILVGTDVHNYVRLITNSAGRTELQMRFDPAQHSFQTVVEYDSLVNKTVDEMIAEGTLIVRSLRTLAEDAEIRFALQKAQADTYGLDLITYEGGQHFAAALWGPFAGNSNNPQLVDFLAALDDSPAVATLYDLWLTEWQNYGGKLFSHFLDVGYPSEFGNWGMVDYLGQDSEPGAQTYKLDALTAFNEGGAWWNEGRDPTAFLHGVRETGTSGSDQLAGTVEEDVLIGLDGDDMLVGGPGDDGLFGGAGANIVDAGAGNDVIVLTSTAETIIGGDGIDTLKAANNLASFSLSAVNATEVEIIDLRNAAATTFDASADDVFTFNTDAAITIIAETADMLELTGLTLHTSGLVDGTYEAVYTGLSGGNPVEVTVHTDSTLPPDVILL